MDTAQLRKWWIGIVIVVLEMAVVLMYEEPLVLAAAMAAGLIAAFAWILMPQQTQSVEQDIKHMILSIGVAIMLVGSGAIKLIVDGVFNWEAFGALLFILVATSASALEAILNGYRMAK